jgi:hypothetical protein
MSPDDFQPDYDLEEDFPNLRSSGWAITSNRSTKYNCIAYAANDLKRYWDTSAGYYWPPGALKEDSIAGWADAFRVLSYKHCDDARLELGVDKIAIYAKDGIPTHVARQLESGTWTSKLGSDEDICHHTLEALNGSLYGAVVSVMKRVRYSQNTQSK